MNQLTLVLPLILLLAACGQSGALYLPEAKREAAVSRAPTPAVAQTPAAAPSEAPAPAAAKPKTSSATPLETP